MVEAWPTGVIWLTEYREHAQLMKYLLKTRDHVDRTESQTVPADDLKMLVQGATMFVVKAQNIPDMTTVQDMLRTIRGDTKVAKEEVSQKFEALKKELRKMDTQMEKITAIGEEAKGAAREATEGGKVGVTLPTEGENNGLQNNKSAPMSYAAAAAAAAAAASGGLAISIHSPHNMQTASVQSQREITVNIRNPVAIEHLRATNPRYPKPHIDQQSPNKQVKQIKKAVLESSPSSW